MTDDRNTVTYANARGHARRDTTERLAQSAAHYEHYATAESVAAYRRHRYRRIALAYRDELAERVHTIAATTAPGKE